MISLRAQVIEVLEQAGCKHREQHLPVYASGGAFSAVGGDRSGVNIWAEWWDATPAELADLLTCMAEALRAAGLEVTGQPGRLYVLPDERQDAQP